MSAKGESDRDEVLARLYGDDASGDELGADAAAELESFGRVRALFGQLEDQEPPAAVSAKLLAAAAEHVEASARPGLWQRLRGLFAPIALHPGLAAAASLVLVAGVAGALYVSGGDALEPAGQSRAPAPASAPQAAPPAKRAAAEAPLAEPAQEQLAQEQLAPAESALAEGTAADDAPASAAKADAVESARRERSVRNEKRERARRRTRKRKAPKREPVIGGAHQDFSTEAASAGAEQAPATLGGSAPAPRGAPRPTSDAPPPPRAPTPARTASDDDASERNLAEARALHQRARKAAGAGDCGTVAKLVARIRALAPRYHAAEVARDDGLRRCLQRPGD